MELKDKQTRVTFHNGIGTIGGTIIEVAYKDSQIFFDFGSEYDPRAEIQPRDLQGLLDAKLVPYLNIFDPGIPIDRHTENTFEHKAVFLSHVHLDHSKIINYLDPAVPLYTLYGTKSLLETLNINDDFLFPLHGAHEKNVREVVGVSDNAVIEVGKIRVKVMPVDHDAYGASGLYIETPDLTISYTGDIRLHGYRAEETIKFCEKSKGCDLLLIEGVSISFQEVDEVPVGAMSEVELVEAIDALIKANPTKQITFNYYITNIERIMKIIEKNPRTVVLDAYYSYILKDATGFESLYYSCDDKNYGLDANKRISYDILLSDKGKYFWQLTNKEDVKKLKSGGIYIHSNAMPLGEFDPAYAPFVESFAVKGIAFELMGSSGHAYPKDLMWIIDKIKPKLLIPIHSYHPERLLNKNGDRMLPFKGQVI